MLIKPIRTMKLMPEMDSQEPRAAEEAADAGAASAVDLYEDQLEAYHQALDEGLEVAGNRFGFVLYHSLSGSEIVNLRRQMGFVPQVATDHYNLGVVAAEQEKYPEAIKHFQKAMQMDPDLAEAEFNLALAQEKSGDVNAARKQWSSYIKRESINESDRNTVSEHVKELG